MLVLSESDVQAVLDMPSCIDVVRDAFRAYGLGSAFGLQRIHAGIENGAFHVVVGGFEQPAGKAPQRAFSVKVTGVFAPGADGRRARGTGVVVLSDASDGSVLAVLSSATLTRMRTGAVTAVAADYLARAGSPVRLLLLGAGRQAETQVAGLASVRPLERVMVWSLDRELAAGLVARIGDSVAATVVDDPRAAAADATVIVSVTPSRRPLLMRSDIRPGTFVASIGSDAPEKQELDPELLASARVVVDITAQCAAAGELHHAIEAGLMSESDVDAELGAIVGGQHPGRQSAEEIIVFDSTGTALQDAAVAALAFSRANERGLGLQVDLSA